MLLSEVRCGRQKGEARLFLPTLVSVKKVICPSSQLPLSLAQETCGGSLTHSGVIQCPERPR